MDVAVLAGGRSPEHDISLASARMVLRHLDRARYRVRPVFLDRDGWFWPARAPLAGDREWTPGADAHGPLRPGVALDWLLQQAPDTVVVPVLHGPFGEDGTIQGMLELHDVAFVGSGTAASAVAMDKLRTRQALQSRGVPMAAVYEPERPADLALDPAAEFERVRASVGLPCFCKVDCSGSSRGVQRVASWSDFAAFAQWVAAERGRFRRWFAEALVAGEEITVAVLGNTGADLQPLPPVGIYPRFCDHFDERAKYQRGACDEVVPPRGWDRARCAAVERLALECHRTLGCDGMSRTDMIVAADGPVVLEVNTIPGLTETSLLPQAAAAVGISFPQLLDRLIALALERRAASGLKSDEVLAPPGAAGSRLAVGGSAHGRAAPERRPKDRAAPANANQTAGGGPA